MTNDLLLEVGDKIAHIYYGHKESHISKVETIVRVTNTQAIGERGTKYKRKMKTYSITRGEYHTETVPAETWSSYGYKLATPELLEEYKQRKQKRDIERYVSGFNYLNLTEEQQKQVFDLLKSFENN